MARPDRPFRLVLRNVWYHIARFIKARNLDYVFPLNSERPSPTTRTPSPQPRLEHRLHPETKLKAGAACVDLDARNPNRHQPALDEMYTV